MNKTLIATASATALFAPLAHAQSSVTLYGLIDAGIAYTNNVNGGSQWRMTTGTINGSRFGLRGTEDLGGGLKALFVLENGFNANNGALGQDGKLFGRHAYVGLSRSGFGTLTLGRQYDTMVDFVAPLSATAGDFGDTGFAHPFDNDNLNHSVRINNAVKYTSDTIAGFKVGALYGFSNSTNFAGNRAYSVAASYTNGPLKLAGAYLQMNGTKGSTSASPGATDVAEAKSVSQGGWSVGADRMRTYGGGISYGFGPATVGFVYTRSQYDNSGSFGSTGQVAFNNYDVNVRYAVTPAVSPARPTCTRTPACRTPTASTAPIRSGTRSTCKRCTSCRAAPTCTRKRCTSTHRAAATRRSSTRRAAHRAPRTRSSARSACARASDRRSA